MFGSPISPRSRAPQILSTISRTRSTSRSVASSTSCGPDPISQCTNTNVPSSSQNHGPSVNSAGIDASPRVSRARILATLGLFVGLAVVHTWPLATAPGTLARNDNGDAILHEWIMAWVSHQVVTNPLHLFDANIFYPERHTLAYSDHLFVQSMMGA